MNDADIKKALECCLISGCKNCPMYEKGYSCLEKAKEYTLDLINRQQAEIEKFKKVIKEIDQHFLEGDIYQGIAIIIRLAIELEKGGVQE